MESDKNMLAAIPERLSKGMTTKDMVRLAQLMIDDDSRKAFKENFVDWASVLEHGVWSLADYAAAVRYVTYKNFDYSNLDAFSYTFPAKMKKYKEQGKSLQQINNFVSAYRRNKLVTALYERSAVALYILNQPAAQRAVNTLDKIMQDEKASIMARVKAADSLLTHLAVPVEQKATIDINVKGDGLLNDMRTAMADIVERQKLLLERKVINSKDAAQMSLMPQQIEDAEYVEISN